MQSQSIHQRLREEEFEQVLSDSWIGEIPNVNLPKWNSVDNNNLVDKKDRWITVGQSRITVADSLYLYLTFIFLHTKQVKRLVNWLT